MARTKTGKKYANPVRRTQVASNIVKDPWSKNVQRVEPWVEDATVEDPWSKNVEWSKDTSSERKKKKEED
tara:strand:+ start:95 stop:304 length:210 start_codon:yes stop_codon:yes gene_type:complete